MASEKALNRIIEIFESGNIPEAIAISSFPRYDVPQTKWSRMNQILCLVQGSSDCRGMRQWNDAGRKVKKGSRAAYILAPNFARRRETEIDRETGNEREVTRQRLIGFRSIPVFRVEDTDGEPLEYQEIELPDFPLREVAAAWNIPVTAISGNGAYRGLYHLSGKIEMATSEEKTFFHELAHAAHHRILDRKNIPMHAVSKSHLEIVAEFSAAAIGYIVRRETPRTIGNSWQYIKGYSRAKNPVNTCIRVLNECAAVIDEIMNYAAIPATQAA